MQEPAGLPVKTLHRRPYQREPARSDVPRFDDRSPYVLLRYLSELPSFAFAKGLSVINLRTTCADNVELERMRSATSFVDAFLFSACSML